MSLISITRRYLRWYESNGESGVEDEGRRVEVSKRTGIDPTKGTKGNLCGSYQGRSPKRELKRNERCQKMIYLYIEPKECGKSRDKFTTVIVTVHTFYRSGCKL